jgi:hypothetical protein
VRDFDGYKSHENWAIVSLMIALNQKIQAKKSAISQLLKHSQVEIYKQNFILFINSKNSINNILFFVEF